ncbi:MAG: type II toxin-antitoxin system HicB family antitoxin [Elusimicrobia bacterium]|nr:type II toxin-antitoxin system HicB family antitoxin [Elusimicrobiota bacterium]
MGFYTAVLRISEGYWVSLCLENGLTGQGETKEKAIEKLKEAIISYEEVRRSETDIFNAPVSVKELHEFLTIEETEPILEPLELRAMYA